MLKQLIKDLIDLTKDPMQSHVSGTRLSQYQFVVKELEKHLSEPCVKPVALISKDRTSIHIPSLEFTDLKAEVEKHFAHWMIHYDELYLNWPIKKSLTDDDIKTILETIDFKSMVTADDVFYLIARAVEQWLTAEVVNDDEMGC